MTPHQWNRMKELFEQTLDLPREEGPPGSSSTGRRRRAVGASQGPADRIRHPGWVPGNAAGAEPGGRLSGPGWVQRAARRSHRALRDRPRDRPRRDGHWGRGARTRLGRVVALKALPAEAAADRALRKRLRRETRAAATITHPGVATVYALEEIDGQLFIAAEYVEGQSLSDVWPARPCPPNRDRPGHRDRGCAERGACRRRGAPRSEAGERAADGTRRRQGRGLRHRFAGGGGRATSDCGRGHPRHTGLYGPRTAGGWRGGRRSEVLPWASCWVRCWRAAPDGRGDRPAFPTGLDAIITPCLQPDPAARFASRRPALGPGRGCGWTAGPRSWRALVVGLSPGFVGLIYAALLVPAWLARSFMGGRAGLPWRFCS